MQPHSGRMQDMGCSGLVSPVRAGGGKGGESAPFKLSRQSPGTPAPQTLQSDLTRALCRDSTGSKARTSHPEVGRRPPTRYQGLLGRRSI